jgi:Ca2+-binding EF-hand superfamily protein
MDRVKLRRFLLRKTQCALRSLARTNHERWGLLTPFTELTPAQFSQSLAKCGVSLHPDEAAALWREAGVLAPTLSFQAFLRLLHHRMPPSLFDARSGRAFVASLARRSAKLRCALAAADAGRTGFVPLAEFLRACEAARPQAPECQLRLLAERYDVNGDGTVNYSLLLADLASARDPAARGPANPGYGPLDPDIFPHARRPRPRAGASAAAAPAASFAKSCPTRPQNCEIITLQKLAGYIENTGSAQQFFNAFQRDGRLGGAEIAAGVPFPVDAIHQLVATYEGPFTLSRWVHLISDGASHRRAPIDFASLRRMVEDDVVLERIAERARGTKWEEVTRPATTADEFVQSLRKIKIHVNTDDIRAMYEGHGKAAFVAAIRRRTDGP